MPYATQADMESRFGVSELVQLTAPDGALDGPPVASTITTALTDATGLIDSHLRRRYLVPLVAPIPPEIVRACCVLARFDLAHGSNREPTEQMRLARKEVVTWLEQLASGEAVLEGVPGAGGSGAGAKVQDRPRAFSTSSLEGW